MLGTKFKLVGGFKSSVDVMLAMERGEVEGICESYASVWRRHRDWIKDKKVNILFQGGVAPDPDPALKGIPFILDFAKTEEQKSAIRYIYAGQGIGRPFVAPPDLEPGRLNLAGRRERVPAMGSGPNTGMQQFRLPPASLPTGHARKACRRICNRWHSRQCLITRPCINIACRSEQLTGRNLCLFKEIDSESLPVNAKSADYFLDQGRLRSACYYSYR
jgi:hypothetical protein